MISIIMPVYNSGRHLIYAISSIIKNTDFPDYELVIVCSKSNDGTTELCTILEDHPKIRVIHTEREGITKAINVGIKSTNPENDVYLTQDDVIIPKLYGRDWLTELNRIAENEKIGLLTTSGGWGISGKEYVDGFNWFGTWSLYIPRRTINKVGLLDENFSPGPGDDIDYSYQVDNSGLLRAKVDFWVDHHRLTENFNDKIEFIKLRNAGYFRKKNEMPYWDEENIEGIKILIQSETRKIHGCFNDGKVADIETCNKIAEITSNFSDTDIFMDVGANTGVMSMMCKKGFVLSFEPNEEVFEVLRTNAWLNNHYNKAVMIPLKEALFSSRQNYTLEKNKMQGLTRTIPDKNGQLKFATIDDLAVNMGRVKLIKIDCEGSDMEIIKGAINTIKRDSPTIIIESATNLLEEIGYGIIGKCGENTIWQKLEL